MIDWLTTAQLILAVLIGAANLVFGALGKLPKTWNLALLAAVEAGLLAQLVATVFLLAGGQTPQQSVFESFGYLIVALILPLGAVFWATAEPSRYSTLVLGAVPLVVAVMLLRMTQLWG